MRVRELGTRQAPSVLRKLFRTQKGQAPEIIKRIERPYWMERGWVHEGDHYTGNYQTRYGSYSGFVEQQASNSFDFFILSPPEELRRHSHWTCFQHRGENWYHVHMGKRPKDLSSGILTIERLITEAFES
jgi:hypothetical protein